MSIALTLHLVPVIIWVGGMFFAHMVLRPTAAQLLEPPHRIAFMLRIFDRFFPWVWGSVVAIVGSGYWIMFTYYESEIPINLWFMAIIGSLMAIIFLFIYFIPYKKMGRAVQDGEKQLAAASLNLIRPLIATNLLLGLFVSVVALLAKYS